MGYQKIKNLYRDTTILEFKHCYALEKIHGTSAHISFQGEEMNLSSGGEKMSNFVNFLEEHAPDLLEKKRQELGDEDLVVFGELYGGKMQGMRETYGDETWFTAFEVKIGDSWLSVPQAHEVVTALGLEFVPYVKIPAELDSINAQRDEMSIVAVWRGMGTGKAREGVVLRPPFEARLNHGDRILAKHKSDAFRETRTKRKVGVDPKVLTEAREIADEWVTPMRMNHVLDKLPEAKEIEHTGLVVKAMIADVEIEAEGEIVLSKAAKKEIGKRAAQMWRERISKI